MGYHNTFSDIPWEEEYKRSNPGVTPPMCERMDCEIAARKAIDCLRKCSASGVFDFTDATDWLVKHKQHLKHIDLYDDACDLACIALRAGIKVGDGVIAMCDIGRGSFGEALMFKANDLDKRVLDAIWFQRDLILCDPDGHWLLDFDHNGLVTAWTASSAR